MPSDVIVSFCSWILGTAEMTLRDVPIREQDSWDLHPRQPQFLVSVCIPDNPECHEQFWQLESWVLVVENQNTGSLGNQISHSGVRGCR